MSNTATRVGLSLHHHHHQIGALSYASFFRGFRGHNNNNNGILLCAIITPVLLEFLELKYQGKDNTPFETHPKSMMVAATSFLVYCIAYHAYLRLLSYEASSCSPIYNKIAQCCVCVSGHILMAALATVVLPNLVVLSPYLLYSLLATALELYSCYNQVITIMEEKLLVVGIIREWRYLQELVDKWTRRITNFLLNRTHTLLLPLYSTPAP